jgi:membrane protein implicated in regulation of membrane protease activity
MILLIAVLLVVFVPVEEPWGAIVIIVACLLEIVEVAVLRRWSRHLGRRLKPAVGAEAMIGQTAKVVSPCRPTGTVRVHGELWEAQCEEGADAKDTVRIDAVEGLQLLVSPVERGRPRPA